MAQNVSSPHDGEATLKHVVTVILKQAKDGPLSKAMARGGIQVILDVLALLQLAQDALTYHDDYGTVRPLEISHKNLL